MEVVKLSGDSVMFLHFCITLAKMFKGFDVIYTILRKHQMQKNPKQPTIHTKKTQKQTNMSNDK